jgi:BASS family bile acid:Na+ symporter
MTMQQVMMLELQASVFLMVFSFGLQATVQDLLFLVRHPGLLVRSLVAMFVVMPIVAVILVRAFELRLSFEIALVALAISPVPPLLPGKQSRAGGRPAYALGLMAVVSLLAIVVVPLSLAVLGRYTARPLQMPPSEIAKVVLIMTLLPLLAGVLVRSVAPAAADWLEKPMKIVSTVLLLGGVVALLIAAFPVLRTLADVPTLVALAAFVGIGLAAGKWLGGPNPDEASVLALSTASRHPAIALAVAKTNFPDEPYLGVTILLYILVAAIISVPYVMRQRSLASIPA